MKILYTIPFHFIALLTGLVYPMEEREDCSKKPDSNLCLRTQLAQDNLNRRLMNALINNAPEQIREAIHQGANIESAHISVAVKILFTSWNVMPLMLLLEHGANINQRDEKNNLCMSEFLKYDGRDWDSRSQNYNPGDHPSLQYPRGPFFDQEQRSEAELDTKLDQILDWLLEQGMNINSIIPLNGRLFVNQNILRVLASNVCLSCVTHRDWMLMLWFTTRGALFDPSNPYDATIKEALIKLDLDKIARDILLNEQDAAITGLAKQDSSKESPMAMYLMLAVAQNRIAVVDYILAHKKALLEEVDLQDALLRASGPGHAEIIKMLINAADPLNPNFGYTISIMILRAAVQNRTTVVNTLGTLITQLNAIALLDRDIMHQAFVRVARLGYQEPLRSLYTMLTSMVDLKKEEDLRYFSEILNNALYIAVIQRNTSLFSFLLSIVHNMRIERTVNLHHIGQTIRTLLANPNLTEGEREECSRLKTMLKQYVKTLWDMQKAFTPAYVLPPSEASISTLPAELITLIISFLLKDTFSIKNS